MHLKTATLIVIALCFCAIGKAQSDTATPPASLSILGTPSRIVLSCKDLLKSMAWWTRMGFSPMSRSGEKPDSAITLTDGQIVITLDKTSQPSPVLVFRTKNIKRVKELIDSLAFRYMFDVEGPSYSELRLRSPNDVFFSVRTLASEGELRGSGVANPVCGNLTEIASGTIQLNVDRQWFLDLGFKVIRTDSVPYSFVNLGDGRINIGLHFQRDIPSAALTYFSPDMDQRIDRLKKSGIVPIDEMPTEDGRIGNAIFESPDGQLVYLFEGTK